MEFRNNDDNNSVPRPEKAKIRLNPWPSAPCPISFLRQHNVTEAICVRRRRIQNFETNSNDRWCWKTNQKFVVERKSQTRCSARKCCNALSTNFFFQLNTVSFFFSKKKTEFSQFRFVNRSFKTFHARTFGIIYKHAIYTHYGFQ